jgi:hypothetical protein
MYMHRYILYDIYTYVNIGNYFPSIGQLIFAHLHVDDVCAKNEPQFIKVIYTHW